MNKTLKYFLTGLVILALAALLVYTGIWIGRYGFNPFASRWDTPGWGMMAGYDRESCSGTDTGRGWGKMVGQARERCPGIDFGGEGAEPLDIHEVEQILEDYLADTGDPDLDYADIMIFDNHAYAQILESSTGMGAMEVLVDFQTRGVYPEHGPNMMWNLKYSPMGYRGSSRGPGMMGSGPGGSTDLADYEDMSVSPEEAIGAAQAYLDSYRPGLQADDHAVSFYGYYTLHVLEDGEVSGMLSVNGYSGQAFYHHWHGELLDFGDHNDDH